MDIQEQWVSSLITGIFTVSAAIYAAVLTTRREQKKGLDEKFRHLEERIEQQIGVQQQQLGEALTAFRNKDYQLEMKSQEIEIYLRDHYVNKEDYRETLKELKDTMSRVENKLDQSRPI